MACSAVLAPFEDLSCAPIGGVAVPSASSDNPIQLLSLVEVHDCFSRSMSIPLGRGINPGVNVALHADHHRPEGGRQVNIAIATRIRGRLSPNVVKL